MCNMYVYVCVYMYMYMYVYVGPGVCMYMYMYAGPGIRRGRLLPWGSGDVEPAGAGGTVYPALHPQAAAPGTGTITSGEAHGPHGRSAESALNLPAMHTSHPLPALAVAGLNPGLQTHALSMKTLPGPPHRHEVRSAVAGDPCWHQLQGALPTLALYFPAGQAAHGPPLGPVVPTSHAHELRLEEPTPQVMHLSCVYVYMRTQMHACVYIVWVSTTYVHGYVCRSHRR